MNTEEILSAIEEVCEKLKAIPNKMSILPSYGVPEDKVFLTKENQAFVSNRNYIKTMMRLENSYGMVFRTLGLKDYVIDECFKSASEKVHKYIEEL